LQLLGEFELVIFREKDFNGLKNIPDITEARNINRKVEPDF